MKEDITSGTKRKKDNKDVPLVNKRIKEQRRKIKKDRRHVSHA